MHHHEPSCRRRWSLGYLFVGAFVALASAASAATPAKSHLDSYDALMARLGGEPIFRMYLRTMSPQGLQAILRLHGSDLVIHNDIEPMEADDCPDRFPEAERNKWHLFNGGHYFIDGQGRPQTAYRNLPPIQAGTRDTSCQSFVNDLAPGTWDAGHLIAASLGGWGRRANLVPQNPNFNQQNWNYMEQQVAKCSALGSGSVLYKVQVAYPSADTNLPSTFTADITIGSDNIKRTFQNTSGGGGNGTAYKDQIKSWLIEHGCQ